MADLKTTEAQRRASRAYEERNREKTKVENYRRSARTFVRHHAEPQDLIDLMDIFMTENPKGEFFRASFEANGIKINRVEDDDKEKEDLS